MSGEAPESREGQVPTSPPTGSRPPPSVTSGAAVERPPQTLTRATDSVWVRIKRHKVAEWTLAYVAFGYASLHGVQMLRETFEWPLLIPRLTVFVLLVGAPVAVTLAWYHGHRAQHRISGAELSILIALLLVAGSVLWWASRTGSRHVASAVVADATHFNTPLGDKSIAVLPFVDLSEKHDQEYFADGMAEEILDRLAKLPGMRVIGRTSSFQFKGKTDDLRKIGSALGAAYVVEGSVRKAGDRFRITAQLIGTHDGSHLWSETYDETVGDVLKVQDRIAIGAVRALQVTVGADDLQSRATLKNPEAYDVYLRGRHDFDRFDKPGLESAAGYFQQALELDPAFIRAAEWLALAQLVPAELNWVPSREGYERARASVERGLTLNPKSGGLHSLMALILGHYDWNWSAAEQEAKRAVALDPRDAGVLENAGDVYFCLGRWDEAARLLTASLAIDPLFPATHWLLADTRIRSGRFPEAEAEFHKVLEISPSAVGVHFNLGRILLFEGRLEAALAEMRRETTGRRNWGLALVYHRMGRKAESDAALQEYTNERADDDSYGIADAHAYRGEVDQAFAWLDRAYRHRETGLIYIKGNPVFKTVEADPRYKAFLRKMNLS
jgi:adenylate cyclase